MYLKFQKFNKSDLGDETEKKRIYKIKINNKSCWGDCKKQQQIAKKDFIFGFEAFNKILGILFFFTSLLTLSEIFTNFCSL